MGVFRCIQFTHLYVYTFFSLFLNQVTNRKESFSMSKIVNFNNFCLVGIFVFFTNKFDYCKR